MARLKGVDFQPLAKLVDKGRKSLLLLHVLKGTREDLVNVLGDLQELRSYDDIATTPSMLAFAESAQIDQLEVERLKREVQVGEEAEAKLLRASEFLCTSMNPNDPLPGDAAKGERDPPSSNPRGSDHPSYSNHDDFLLRGSYDIDEDSVFGSYCRLVDFCQRHRHNQGYCMRERHGKRSCRFEFPRDILKESRVVVIDHKRSKGPYRGEVKRTEVKLQRKTNDRWTNAHSRVGMCMWGGNMDFSLLIDEFQVANYVAKYCTKSETPSDALKAVVKTKCSVAREEQDDDSRKILRRAFNNLAGKRDKTVMETCHLILSTPIVECSHSFTLFNLLPAYKSLNAHRPLDKENYDPSKEKAFKLSPVDLYANRMCWEHWKLFDAFERHTVGNGSFTLQSMPLVEFIKRFKLHGQKIREKIDSSKPQVYTFSPDVKCTKGDDHWRYCLVSLMKRKPWIGYKEQVFDGRKGSLECDLTKTPKEVRAQIVEAYQAYFRDPSLPTYGADDPFHRAVDEARLELSPQSAATQHSILDESELNGFMPGAAREEDEEYDFEVAKAFTMRNPFLPSEVEEEKLEAWWKELKEDPYGGADRVSRHLRDFDLSDLGYKQQHDAVAVFLKMMGLWKNEHNEFEPAKRQGNVCNNVMLVPGPAGAGKSYLIDCLVAECQERFHEKTRKIGFVHIVAPTGKAAMGAGGYTLQSKAGLSVPCKDLTRADRNKLSSGDLKSLQEDLNYQGKIHLEGRQLIAVVIDEYSMVSSSQLYWISRRLQEATVNEVDAFGGVCIAMFGDPGQLPPVGGTPLWRIDGDRGKSKISGVPLIGHELYMGIETVMELSVVRRQSGQYRDALMRLRDGKTTEEDWRGFWNKNCSSESMGERRCNEEFFSDPNTLFLFSNNEACLERNKESIKRLNEPIVRITAEHDDVKDSKSSSKSSEVCGDLAKTLYVSVGCKIMLRRNLATNKGLVNGSVGFVKDIVYNDADDPSRFLMPRSIIVDFESYTGPPYFTEEGREKWIPLIPQKQFIDRVKGTYRRQYPICIAYAITVHKSQGMTVRGKVVVEIGDKENTSGFLYVASSRTTAIENLCLGKSKPFDRWSTKLQTKAMTLRLLEDERLRNLAKETKVFFEIQ